MTRFFTIVKSDYLQRTRSYAFLITLCISLAVAYTFVPAPNASYSTIRIADHIGYYNSAWFGYVTAIMTSVFLSLVGFYLINSAIKTDIDTKVGQIVAATKITNFNYLCSKVVCNFLVLLTIVLVVFLMSIILFFLYNDGYSFELLQFVKPYLIIVTPTLFFISVVAVVFEVVFRKYSVLQNVGYFFLFSFLMFSTNTSEMQYSLDLFGSKIVIHELEETVKEISSSNEETMTSIGFALGNTNQVHKFNFNGMDFPMSFIISRLLIILLGIIIIAITSSFFHRFSLKEKVPAKKRAAAILKEETLKEVVLSALPKAQVAYGILPLLKTECLLLFRKGNKWMWILNIVGMILLAILPLKLAHQMVLPILWFLQVSRLSDLATKETTNNVHYFAFTSFRPFRRLLISQVLAGVILMLVLASPLLIRLGLSLNFSDVILVCLGGIFVVLTATLLGLLSKGKKLFEVLFFMVTYANINSIPFADYFGAFEHHKFYAVQFTLVILVIGSVGFLTRKYQLKKTV